MKCSLTTTGYAPVIAATALCLGACRGGPDFEVGPGLQPELGVEVQGYPAGIISGLRFEWPNEGPSMWSARVAYNASDRQDWAEHDDETGGGIGLGVGWRYWKDAELHNPGEQGAHYRGWHFGGRVDFWALEIDWQDFSPSLQSGRSDVLVAQPTLEAGYSWQTLKGHRIDLTFGVGAEINIDTDGEDVGEGAIALIGLSFMPSAR